MAQKKKIVVKQNKTQARPSSITQNNSIGVDPTPGFICAFVFFTNFNYFI